MTSTSPQPRRTRRGSAFQDADRVPFLTIEFETLRRNLTSVDHLHPEAVAAYVDDELSSSARHRAQVHMVHCAQCRADVEAQRKAAQCLREHEDEVHVPSALLQKLQSIAAGCPEGPKVAQYDEDLKDTAAQLPQELRRVLRRLRKH